MWLIWLSRWLFYSLILGDKVNWVCATLIEGNLGAANRSSITLYRFLIKIFFVIGGLWSYSWLLSDNLSVVVFNSRRQPLKLLLFKCSPFSSLYFLITFFVLRKSRFSRFWLLTYFTHCFNWIDSKFSHEFNVLNTVNVKRAKSKETG